MAVRSYYRKVTPKVEGGRPLRKNRHDLTPNIWSGNRGEFAVERERPGREYRHLLRKSDIMEFITMIPDWESLSGGLNGILLAAGEQYCDGWYSHSGVIGICAWHRNLWQEACRDYYTEHQALFERLALEVDEADDYFLLKFTEHQARAYQLLHVFLHELGHHRDRMTTKSKTRTGRGEPYAEDYALEMEKTVWDRYFSVFRFG